ncbi:MAG: divalent-cation tolerance protein CutA [Desulfovibrio sp.]|jgi:periplasmic divalent cation tolerance protein|nr:divalent-cation tolerance protein CutA [Desulfovibrio sp.]
MRHRHQGDGLLDDILFVYVTAPDRATACALAGTLVQERLAACANVLHDIESLYWWQGAMQQSKESVCILKTTAADYAALEKRTRELHTYDVPCIVAMKIARGHADFLQWIAEETLHGRRRG